MPAQKRAFTSISLGASFESPLQPPWTAADRDRAFSTEAVARTLSLSSHPKG